MPGFFREGLELYRKSKCLFSKIEIEDRCECEYRDDSLGNTLYYYFKYLSNLYNTSTFTAFAKV